MFDIKSYAVLYTLAVSLNPQLPVNQVLRCQFVLSFKPA